MALFGILGDDPSNATGVDPNSVSGILGGAALPALPPWQQGVGILGSALKDAGAWFSGRPQDATAVAQYGQQLRQYQAQRARQGAVAAMTSGDPNVRQNGYAAAMMLGMDPRQFQAMQAARAMPQLLQDMTQGQTTATLPARSVNIGGNTTLNATAPSLPGSPSAPASANINFGTSTDLPAVSATSGPMNLMDAIKATGSPELGMQLAPDIIQNQMNIASKSWRNATAPEKVALGYKPSDPVQINAYNEVRSSVKPQAQLDQENYEAAHQPITPEQNIQNSIGWMNATRPVAMGLNGLYDPRSKSVIGGPSAAGTPNAPDPNAPNITGQTGLSPGAFNYIIGNTSALPRDAASRRAIQAEANAYLQRSGTDISSIQSQFKAQNNILQNNLQRANQMGISENEIAGTVNNFAPVADQLGGGNLRWVKGAAQFVGGLNNNPNAQQYSVYLNQLRSELANYNAVSAGKITENGTPRTDDGDYAEAEKVIKNGLDSGGAQGLLRAVQATSAKNRGVVGRAIDNANQAIWDLFGVGQNYKPRFSQAANAPWKPIPAPQDLPRKGGFVNGQIYQDGNGNKAKYLNGQWIPQ